MPKPCIISLGERVYRLDDGTPVLVGDQQDEVLQAFLEEQVSIPRGRLTPDEVFAFDNDEQMYEFFAHAGLLHPTVRMSTRLLQLESMRTNVSAIMKSLKRGPLGTAIELPGKKRKGRGYLVRIRQISSLKK